MTDDAITPLTVQDNATPAFRVARERGEWRRNSRIDDAVHDWLSAALGDTVDRTDDQHHGHQPDSHR